MKITSHLLLTLAWLAFGEFAVQITLADETRIDYTREIRPILAKACFACHGNDAGSREAELRLDRREDAIRSRDGRQAIHPQHAADSELIKRITATDVDERMPPADAGPPLTAQQIELLQRWIAQGANYDVHWAFIKPQSPPRPAITNNAWVKNEIDEFILAKLEERGLSPSHTADRTTLIRRLSLDLIGLPPSPAEVDAFLNDTSPTAYDDLVNRLLNSPRFGERWAQVWLDLARYADSMGYEKDLPRTIWRYRDWVIQAFQNDMPFDQFTIEQLAGDLLPEATLQQKLATALHRNTLTNQEGGTDDEEFRVAAVKDRADTTLQVWMGLTMGCAKCHSHKYDPITQREYYQFYAFFNQTADADRGDDYPTLTTPTAEQQRRLTELDQKIAATNQQFVPFATDMQADFEAWLEQLQANAADRQALPKTLGALIEIESQQRTAAQTRQLQAHFAREVAQTNQTARTELAALQQQRQAVKPPTTPVMQELPAAKRRPTHLHVRGNFLEPGEEVSAGVPSDFGSLPAAAPSDRLGVAMWLIHPDNPLTARVQVNRFWARLFGRGIVLTEEDFGTQGDLPTHPELLDWLAVEFRTRGWSVKELLRLIVSSATYRQSAQVTESLQQQDPDNTWLARGPRFRLEAETVRDQALHAAGLLGTRIGGPSVMPPQPPGIWKITYSKLEWETSSGADRHRRALYTYWRRTSPYPSMLTFDAGTRETCVLRRVRTNTPLQALVTLNDPVFVEAAGGLAQRMLTEGGSSTAQQLQYGVQLLLSRQPDDFETPRLLNVFQSTVEHFRQNTVAAKSLIESAQVAVPTGVDETEFAAMIVIGNVLLNLDETLMKP